MPLHELKKKSARVEKIEFQESFTLLAHDSTGHLQRLRMSILQLSSGIESKWKHCSSPLNIEKNTGVLYESILNAVAW